MARDYARMGLEVELQVRYHPAPADDGDIDEWLASCGGSCARSDRSGT